MTITSETDHLIIPWPIVYLILSQQGSYQLHQPFQLATPETFTHYVPALSYLRQDPNRLSDDQALYFLASTIRHQAKDPPQGLIPVIDWIQVVPTTPGHFTINMSPRINKPSAVFVSPVNQSFQPGLP